MSWHLGIAAHAGRIKIDCAVETLELDRRRYRHYRIDIHATLHPFVSEELLGK
jgi:hypothetical protein